MVSLPQMIQFMKTTDVGIMDIDVKTNILKQGSKVHNIDKNIHGNKYEPEVVMEDKVYLEYYRHQPRNVVVHETPTNIKAQGL